MSNGAGQQPGAGPEGWWEDFFTGGWLTIQPRVFSPEQTATEIEQIAALLKLQAGSRVLDVPCGDGRHVLALARRGIRADGVDLSGPLLERARRAALAESLTCRFIQADMRDLDAALPDGGVYDAALCFWGSFGYFDEDGDRDMLDGFAWALRPGGRLLLDLHTSETLFPRFTTRGWSEVQDWLVLEERRYDPITGRAEATWTLAGPRGEREKHHSSIRIYGMAELIGLLRDAGFSGFEVYGHLAGRRFEIGAQRAIVIATRGA